MERSNVQRPTSNVIAPEEWIAILLDCGIFEQGEPQTWPVFDPSTNPLHQLPKSKL